MRKGLILMLLNGMLLGASAQNVTVTGADAITNAASPFATISAAFISINAAPQTGNNIVIQIINNTNEPAGAIILNQSAGPWTSLLIQPLGGPWTISGSSSTGLIVLNGADNVTLNGSNGSTVNSVCPVSVATRDLTIINTNSGTSNAVVWLQSASGNGATNNKIINCNIAGNSNTTTLFAAGSGSSTISTSSLGTGNHNNHFINNNISKTQYGIYSHGASAANKNTGTVISQNLINSITPNNVQYSGIWVGFEDGVQITGNSISELSALTDVTAIAVGLNPNSIGIDITGGKDVTNTTITKNIIGTVTSTDPAGYSAVGISVFSTGTTSITNNIIYGVTAPSGGTDDAAVGIYIASSGTTNIYHNTVSMTGNRGAASKSSFALAVGSNNPPLNIRNNILVNSQTSTGAGQSYAIGLAGGFPITNTANLVSDNNDLFVSGTSGVFGKFLNLHQGSGGNLPAIQDWRDNTGRDLVSKNIQPTFMSSTNLHLVTPDNINFNNLEGTGAAVAVTDDIDCQARPNGTAPDIGADEFVGVSVCSMPTSVNTTSVTTTTSSVSFSCTSCTGTYIVEYGLPGFIPGAAATAGAGGTVVTGNVSPIILTGLLPGTDYQLYVRQNCGSGSFSINSTMASFTTLCDNLTLPVFEGFNTPGFLIFPHCWSSQPVTGSNTVLFMTSTLRPATTPYEGTRHAYYESWNYPVGNEVRLVSKGITTTGSASVDVSFRWYNENNSSFSTGIYLNEGVQLQYSLDKITWTDAGSFIPRHDGSLAVGTGEWKLKSITLPAGAANQPAIYLGFKFHSSHGDNCSLDALQVVATPLCPAPVAVTVGSVTGITASVSFSGAGSSFIADYGISPYTPGTGALPGSGGTAVIGSGSPILLTGLLPNTTYELYLRQDCTGSGNGYSANSTVVSFTTPLICPAPTGINVSSITSSTASINFSSLGSAFIVDYGLSPYTPGTGATAGAGGIVVSGSGSPIILTGLTQTTTYQVYVRQDCTGAGNGYSLNTTAITFSTQGPPPPNDEAPGAISLSLGSCSGSPFTNTGGTQSAGEPFASCKGTAGFNSVWYKFDAPASGAVRISNDYASGTLDSDTRIALFSATDVNNYSSFTIIACDDDNGSVISSRSVLYATGLTPGTTYYVQVDGSSVSTTQGTFCLSVEELTASMLSTGASCSGGQSLSSYNDNYNGWLSVVDNSGNLRALVRNINGTGAGTSTYTNSMTLNSGPVRTFNTVAYLDRNFQINNTQVSLADVRFFYLNSELTGLVTADVSVTSANLGATKQAVSVCYPNLSTANGATTFLNQSANNITTDGLARWIDIQTSGFSNFYLSGNSNILPTGLLAFSGYREAGHNVLKWTTSNESNNRGFEIQRSADGINFLPIGFVNTIAPGGTSNTDLNYTFVDNNPAGAKQYYRLRQTDIDGQSKLSTVILIKGVKPLTLVTDGLFPNPANTLLNVLVSTPVRDKVRMLVIDVTGRTISEQIITIEAGSNTIPVDISKLSNGSYLIKLYGQHDQETVTGRFVKQ